MSKIIDYPTMATVKDAANQFSVSTAFVRKLCREGRIRYTAYIIQKMAGQSGQSRPLL